MRKALLHVRTAPASADVEAQYNDWYDRTHIPQILENVPGITGIQRFRLYSSHGSVDSSAPYLAIYEVEADDPEQVLAQLRDAARRGVLDNSETLAQNRPDAVLAEIIVEGQAEP